MRKASSNLIMTGGNRGSRASTRRSQVPNSNSAAANLGGSVSNEGAVGHDSCSSGGNDSCGNDSLGSGQHSPSPSESVAHAAAVSTPRFSQKNLRASGRPLGIHAADDSDGNNADDDSIHSFNVKRHFGYLDKDDIPTRDVGPERLGQSLSSHSELGIPIHPPPDNRSRYI